MNKIFLNALVNFDLFGTSIGLNFMQKEQYRTKIGKLLIICFI